MRPESGFRIAPNRKNDNDITICRHEIIVFFFFSFFFFFDVVLFLLSSSVTDLSFMSISSLVLWLWQFSLIKDWPEIRKSEIPPSEFCPISENWGKSGIVNWMSLMKCYWMLQNVRVTAFTVSELLRGNQQGAKLITRTHPPRLGLTNWPFHLRFSCHGIDFRESGWCHSSSKCLKAEK